MDKRQPAQTKSVPKDAPVDCKLDDDDYIDIDANFKPFNNMVTPLLTDLYELTMTYSYFKLNKHTRPAVFDLFFRRAPFKGVFAVFCGLEEVLRFVHSFKFTDSQIKWLRSTYPAWDPKFFDYLSKMDCSELTITAMKEGSVCFPRVPLMRIEGPLGVCQVLETVMLNLVNFPTLIATTAARHRLTAGRKKILLEFGLRRAQGPDGGCTASRYSYVGGYNGTSNVAASYIYGIPCRGTHAHSYVCSFKDWDDIPKERYQLNYADSSSKSEDFVALVKKWRSKIDPRKNTNDGELVAFAAYALDYAGSFLALIDTYNTITSGMINFVIVANALMDLGYKPAGIRIDSGNLIQLSIEIREYFTQCAAEFKRPSFTNMTIVASNDIDEEMLEKLNDSACTGYGIGTRLVTCKGNPALGGVYKLVELDNIPRIKLSSERFKTTIPGKKQCYRMYDKKGEMLCDVLTHDGAKMPAVGKEFSCKDFFNPIAKIQVTPSRIEQLLHPVWVKGRLVVKLPKIKQLRDFAQKKIFELPKSRTRRHSPVPYRVLMEQNLFNEVQKMMEEQSPELKLA